MRNPSERRLFRSGLEISIAGGELLICDAIR